MTEFVLPGKGGLDLEIRRLYDTGTAKMDSQCFEANLSNITPDVLVDESDAKNLEAAVNITTDSDTAVAATDYRENAGDFAYSIGQGWRLNFPYIKTGTSSFQVRTSSGAFYSLNDMEFIKEKSTLKSDDSRILWFENHESEDFSLKLIQITDKVEKESSYGTASDLNEDGLKDVTIDSYYVDSAVLYEKNGREYHFDHLGRLLSINDTNGNMITLDYSDSKLRR